MTKIDANIDISTWKADEVYNDLPTLPPKPSLETIPVLKACIEARAALAALNQASRLLPNPAILLNTVPLLEAGASSEIENIVTTNDNLFRFAEHEQGADADTMEALRYRIALIEGFASIRDRPMNVNTAESVCTTLKATQISVRTGSGTALLSSSSRDVVYTPPEGEQRLRALLDNWADFMHNATAYDPLVRMAVGHYQFEAIHPFVDGNGRTGRILNVLFLAEQGLLELPILYLSGYINQHRSEYYRLLLSVTRDGNWEEFILYILAAVSATATWTLETIDEIRELFNRTRDDVRSRLPKVYSHELIATIFEQPYCRISNLTERGIAKRETASKYLKQLAGLGILEERQIGREVLFVNSMLMSALTRSAH